MRSDGLTHVANPSGCAVVYVPQKVAITDGTQLLVWIGPA